MPRLPSYRSITDRVVEATGFVVVGVLAVKLVLVVAVARAFRHGLITTELVFIKSPSLGRYHP
jgi:hypothetical protein